jgi:hypothetical protein
MQVRNQLPPLPYKDKDHFNTDLNYVNYALNMNSTPCDNWKNINQYKNVTCIYLFIVKKKWYIIFCTILLFCNFKILFDKMIDETKIYRDNFLILIYIKFIIINPGNYFLIIFLYRKLIV